MQIKLEENVITSYSIHYTKLYDGTGALGDMGCHLIDPPFRVLGLGYPTEVETSVGSVFKRDWVPEYYPESCPISSRTQLKFSASDKNQTETTMTWTDGGLRPFHPELIPADHPLGEEDSSNGVIMIGEKGIMTCATYARNPKIYVITSYSIHYTKLYDTRAWNTRNGDSKNG